MALVDYSDSEGSDNEQPLPQGKPAAKPANTNFAVDRSNPQKIRVKLADSTPTNGAHEDEPAPKRAKLGGGFGGFNAMLPAPKRNADKTQQSTTKAPARKVFSLKTSSEVGFSRESDAEMRQLFAEQDDAQANDADDVGLPDVPKKTPQAEVTTKGNTFMFKPLSVARGGKKKKPVSAVMKPASPISVTSSEPAKEPAPPTAPPTKKKVSLFSAHRESDMEPAIPEPEPEDDGVTSAYPGPEDLSSYPSQPADTNPSGGTQSLDSIASDLNLTPAQRRQLFGRGDAKAFSATNVVNFNTDREYAANEALRANGGDQAQQHNPVRAIAPGKHSLRQLVASAQGQKEALEESFAAGKRNRKEAGSKYGW